MPRRFSERPFGTLDFTRVVISTTNSVRVVQHDKANESLALSQSLNSQWHPATCYDRSQVYLERSLQARGGTVEEQSVAGVYASKWTGEKVRLS